MGGARRYDTTRRLIAHGLRCGVIVGALGAALWAPLTPARAAHVQGGGGGAVLLRYRFSAGQLVAFAATASETVTLESPLTPGRATTTLQHISAQLNQHVLSVDAAGVATIAQRESALAITTTLNGQAHTQTVPSIDAGTIVIAPNGGTHVNIISNRALAINVQASAMFPSYPVAPGARWSMTQSGTLALSAGPGSPLHVSVQSTLTGFGYADGEPVAIIDSTAPYHARVALGTSKLQLEEDGAVTQRVLFGLATGQPVSIDATAKMRLTVSITSGSGLSFTSHGTLLLHSRVQRIGV